MAQGKFIAYYRVSTQQQGRSGLGLDAQKAAVLTFLDGGNWSLIDEFVEVESGKLKDRPQLQVAFARCKATKAALIVAKLDRLSRDVRQFLEFIDAGVEVRFVELPDVDSTTAQGRMMLTMLAGFAEFEARRISERTKSALAAAKERGIQLGKAGPANIKSNIEERRKAAQVFAEKLRPTITALQQQGYSQRAMAQHLNELGVRAAWGGAWSQTQVARLLKELGK